jgi:outer membrane protein
MRPIGKLVGILTLCSINFSPSFGDDLVTILNLALENDPTLRQAKANYRANRENVIQSQSTLLPSFGLQAATTRLTSGPSSSRYMDIPNPITGELVSTRVMNDHSFYPGINNHNWGVGLNQSILNLSKWYNFQSAQANDRAAAVNLASQEQDLIMRVSMAYFDVLRAQELLDTNLQEEEAALTSLEQTEQRERLAWLP